jgi:hypothetical protein
MNNLFEIIAFKILGLIDVHNYISFFLVLVSLKFLLTKFELFKINEIILNKTIILTTLIFQEAPRPRPKYMEHCLLETMMADAMAFKLKTLSLFDLLPDRSFINLISLIANLKDFEKINKEVKGAYFSHQINNPTIAIITDSKITLKDLLQDLIYNDVLVKYGMKQIGVASDLVINESKLLLIQRQLELFPTFPKITFGQNIEVTLINCFTKPEMSDTFIQTFGQPHVNNIIVVYIPKTNPIGYEVILNLTEFFAETSFSVSDVYYVQFFLSGI